MTQTTYQLPSGCVINNAEALKQSMLAQINEDESIFLDGSSVSQLDTAGIQLLYAFVQEATLRNKPVQWSNPSEKLIEVAELLGMREKLGL